MEGARLSLLELVDAVEGEQVPELRVLVYTEGCERQVEMGRDSLPYYVRVFGPAPDKPALRDYHEDGFADIDDFLAAVREISEQVVGCPTVVVYFERLYGHADGDLFETTFDVDVKVNCISPLMEAPF